jgi:hypothetical protein
VIIAANAEGDHVGPTTATRSAACFGRFAFGLEWRNNPDEPLNHEKMYIVLRLLCLFAANKEGNLNRR